MEVKFKGDLIEGVKEKLSEQEKVIRKILNEVKMAKKDMAVRLPIE